MSSEKYASTPVPCRKLFGFSIYHHDFRVVASIFDLRSMSYESMLNIRLKLKEKTKNLQK